MVKKYENEFKVMIAELLLSGVPSRQVSEEYSLNISMINRWRREYQAKSGDFTKNKELSAQELEIKTLKKQLRNITLERDILKKAVHIFSKSDS